MEKGAFLMCLHILAQKRPAAVLPPNNHYRKQSSHFPSQSSQLHICSPWIPYTFSTHKHGSCFLQPGITQNSDLKGKKSSNITLHVMHSVRFSLCVLLQAQKLFLNCNACLNLSLVEICTVKDIASFDKL